MFLWYGFPVQLTTPIPLMTETYVGEAYSEHVISPFLKHFELLSSKADKATSNRQVFTPPIITGRGT